MHIDAMAMNAPWRRILAGRLAVVDGDIREAEGLLRSAVSLCGMSTNPRQAACPATEEINLDQTTSNSPSGSRGAAARLEAVAWHELGVIHRRQDRTLEAIECHRRAHRLRAQHGSGIEQWESACELGLDELVTGRFRDAADRFRDAMKQADQLAEGRDMLLAITWSHLCEVSSSESSFDEAIHAARQSRRHWYMHDPASPAVPCADWKLARVLLSSCESMVDSPDCESAARMDEAVALLESACESLAAFGGESAADAQTCADQLEFAVRLRAMLAGSSSQS
jgi:tetratricopeptide (TPR) repeat protein